MIVATPETESARLEALHALDILNTEPEPEFDELVVLASAICETPMGAVSLIDAERQWYKARVGLNKSETPRSIAFCEHAIQQTGLFLVEDAQTDHRFAGSPLVTEEPHVRFYAGMPVTSPNGQALGTICVIDRKPRTLTDGQCAALKILATQVNARLELRMQRKKVEAALHAAEESRMKLVSSEQRFRLFMDNSPLVTQIKDEQSRLVFYNRPFAERFGIGKEDWLGKSNHDLWPKEQADLIQQRDDEVLRGNSLQSMPQTVLERDGRESYWKSYKFPLETADGVRMIGVIGVEVTEDLRREDALRRSQEKLQAANEQLENLARTDALTCLFNRRGFDERLNAEFALARRKSRELAVLVIDVDNFKARNDRFGHPAGDETLRQLAQLLLRTVRVGDFAARYGGEEFVVLLPETGEKEAIVLAERILAAIREHTWGEAAVTISIGVSALHPSMRDQMRLVSLADEALYAAKQTGKDRVVAYGEYFQKVVLSEQLPESEAVSGR